MTPKIQEVVVECADASSLAKFYGQIMQCPWGYQEDLGGVVDAGDLFLFFQQLPPEQLSEGNRLHLDIEVDDLEAAAARAEALGATRTGEQFDDPSDGGGYITLRDPEHNAFCFVCQPTGSWSQMLRNMAEPGNATPIGDV